MSSIFSKIINGEIPSYKIAETDKFFAFLDVFPLVEGHTLIVPKTEINYIFDIDDSTLAEMNVFAKKIAIALEKAIPCKRIGVAVLGLEVPHAHIHLIPIKTGTEINFQNPKLKLSKERFQEIAEKIISFL